MASLLTQLRHVMPTRPLTHAEALRLAELQAAKLLAASGISNAPVPTTLITGFPRLRVAYDRGFNSSGSTAWSWSRGVWQIAVNATEPPTRQRYSIAHEFKHILDEPFKEVLYPTSVYMSSYDRQEYIADYFAACLLMPAVLVKRAYYDERLQTVEALAARFAVSTLAMRRRLETLGLIERTPRHATEPLTPKSFSSRQATTRHATGL